MASKQLGKLRQWAGEVISSRDKTTVTEEFRELEKDIELRKDGAQKLLAASDAYQYALSKKKKNEAFEDAEKLLPIDTLGVVMIVHGEEFGDDSAFGTSLVKLGRAHCKVATLQEAYALTFKDTFLASIEKFTDDIKEYEVQRKKLDSRRLSYDASVAKFEKLKGGKKEKEKHEAEDEMEKARQRYEETSEDVQAHMHAIQENEIVQLHELTSFLDLEINFVQQYLNVLKDVKSNWHDESSISPVKTSSATGLTHLFSRSSQEAVGTVRSKRSSRSNFKESSDSSDDEDRPRSIVRRRSSTLRRSESNTSKPSSRPSSRPPSRPASRTSRKRADSTGTVGEKEDKDKDKSRRLSVAGWASSAVGSVTGRSKKNKDKFSALHDDADQQEHMDDDEDNAPVKKPSSFPSLSMKLSRDKSKESLQGSPKAPARILKPPSLQDRKIARALHNFSGAADELTFKVGDEIVVINEVLDGWWMGELDGNKGLFPTSYVEVLARPTVPRRPPSSNSHNKESASSLSSGDSRRQTLANDSDSYIESDIDEHHHIGIQPLAHDHSPFYGGPPDAASITSNATEDEDEKLLAPITRNSATHAQGQSQSQPPSSRSSPRIPDRKVLQTLNPPPQSMRRSTTSDIVSRSSTPSKKAPPPPPPRRPANPASVISPPIPDRPYKSARTQSAGSLKAFIPTPASSVSSHGYDRSPFESAVELDTVEGKKGGCAAFKQNPFQAKGMCSNCFEFHG